MSNGVCPDCNQAGCAAMRDTLLARDFEQAPLYWQYHRLAIDSYCVQHRSYIASAKSLAAHLCGLCIALEQAGDEKAMRGLQKWLSTNPPLQKPVLPASTGRLTIAHVHDIADPEAYGRAVNEWARSAWDAYRDLQPLARQWLALVKR